MNNLEKLTEELEKVSTTANMSLDDVSPAVRGGWSASIATAKEKLPEVRARYQDALLRNAVAIFIGGDKAKSAEFATLIRAENEGLVVNANALYDQLTRNVAMTLPENRGIEWGITQTHRFHLALQEVMHELGLKELPLVSASEHTPFVQTYEDVMINVKSLVRAAVGDSLNKLFVEKDLVKEAMKIRYTSNTVPVIVLNADASETYDLSRIFGKGSTSVDIPDGTEVNKEFLVDTFKEINKKLKGKKSKSENTEVTKTETVTATANETKE